MRHSACLVEGAGHGGGEFDALNLLNTRGHGGGGCKEMVEVELRGARPAVQYRWWGVASCP
ncbi:hypothetical protein HaLaN_01230 [Haematococcus lacustris]|uniref:Uncharacterized protein n=1 Tax=Haematococcus lacustris TaxID=44745 RepID=A0A699Y8S9_HAELA|nr:hypothetical protein HaLaN_01230 [Haematococcus lacustris]